MLKIPRAILMVLAGAAVGLLATAQVRSALSEGGASLAPAGQADGELASLRQQKDALESELEELNKRTAVLEAGEAQARRELDDANARLNDLSAKAGLTALSGPGVVIVISPRTYTVGGEKKIMKTVTDEELLLLVNELNAAGAEAISVSGQRLIARSAIRLAGEFVNINRMPTAMPYEIRALGSAETLDAALRLYGGVYDRLTEFYEISIKKTDRVDIPAYQGDNSYHYAAPVAG